MEASPLSVPSEDSSRAQSTPDADINSMDWFARQGAELDVSRRVPPPKPTKPRYPPSQSLFYANVHLTSAHGGDTIPGCNNKAAVNSSNLTGDLQDSPLSKSLDSLSPSYHSSPRGPKTSNHTETCESKSENGEINSAQLSRPSLVEPRSTRRPDTPVPGRRSALNHANSDLNASYHRTTAKFTELPPADSTRFMDVQCEHDPPSTRDSPLRTPDQASTHGIAHHLGHLAPKKRHSLDISQLPSNTSTRHVSQRNLYSDGHPKHFNSNNAHNVAKGVQEASGDLDHSWCDFSTFGTNRNDLPQPRARKMLFPFVVAEISLRSSGNESKFARNFVSTVTGLMDCARLRKLAETAIVEHSYDAVIFFANKLVTLEPDNPCYGYLLAQGYYLTTQYKRAIHLLREYLPRPMLSGSVEWPRTVRLDRSLIAEYMKCLHLAGQSMVKLSQFQDCIDLLQNFEIAVASQWNEDQDSLLKEIPSTGTKINSLIALLRAEAHESIDVRAGALVWYKKALELDVTCYEAWKKLNEGCMLSPDEEEHFLNSLPFTSELEWLKGFYLSKTSKFVANYGIEISSGSALDAKIGQEQLLAPSAVTSSVTSISHATSDSTLRITSLSKPNLPVPGKKTAAASKNGNEVDSNAKPSSGGGKLSSKYALVTELDTKYKLELNEDLIAAKAQAAFYANRVREAFSLTSSVLERDPYSSSVLMIHLPCLVELGLKNDLYLLAHRMAENAPKSALSWYAVGCYYFLIKSWQNARLYFGKATSLKREFGAAWMAYGYTFAQNGEHDQAFFAYRTAARILVGSHLPNLLIATELTRTKDMVLAKQYALKSVSMQPRDPYPIHELAVILYRSQEYHQAIKQFELVLDLVGKAQMDATWEPTLYNLAQANIKIQNYDRAIELLELSLAILPYNPSTYTLLAFAHHIQGNLQEAIDYYHQALSINPEYDFALLAIEEALNEWVLRQPIQAIDLDDEFNASLLGDDLQDPVGSQSAADVDNDDNPQLSTPQLHRQPSKMATASAINENLSTPIQQSSLRNQARFGASYDRNMELDTSGTSTPKMQETPTHSLPPRSPMPSGLDTSTMDMESGSESNQSMLLDTSVPMDTSVGMDMEEDDDDDGGMLMTPTK